MSDLLHVLNVVLEDGQAPSGAVEYASGIVRQLEDAQQRIQDLQHQLDAANKRICGELALMLRRALPGLNVGVGKEGCKVGYRSKHLILQPDPKRGIWNVKSGDPRFARRFMNRRGSKTVLGSMEPLASAIVQHFREYYKTLGEDIIGTGIVLVEGHRGTITDLAEWYEQHTPKKRLNSRSSRRAIG